MNELFEFLNALLILGGIGFWVFIAIEVAFLMFCLEWERHVLAPISLVLSFLIITKFGMPPGQNFNYYAFFQSLISWWAIAWIVGYFFLGTCYAIVKWWLFCKEKYREYVEKQRYFFDYRLLVMAGDFEEEIKRWFYTKAEIDSNLQGLRNFLTKYKISSEKIDLIDKNTDRATIHTAGNEILFGYAKEMREAVTQGYKANIPFKGLVKNLWDYWSYCNSLPTKPDPANHKLLIYSWIIYFPVSIIWTIINDPVKHLCIQIYNSISSVLYKIADNAWKD